MGLRDGQVSVELCPVVQVQHSVIVAGVRDDGTRRL